MGKSDNFWVPITIDLSMCVAVKQDSEDNGHLIDRGVVYLPNAEYFVVNMEYDKLIEMFKQSKK